VSVTRIRDGGRLVEAHWERHILASGESMEKSMLLATIHMTSRSIGLAVSAVALGLLLCSPADAQYRQRAYNGQWSSGGVTVWPRNTPDSYVVCWNGCGHPGSIVMGADPDPFIRSQILRDASGFFGGGGR
jgi:hypothetical protein